MAAMDLLSEQHREVEDLLRRIKEAKGGERVRLLGAVAEALTLHAALEERFFYPALREYGLGELADRGLKDHQEVRHLISELMDIKQRDPRLNDMIEKLEKSIKAHVEEEEGEIFQRAREKMEDSALEHAETAMRNAISSLKDKELLEAADEERVPAP